MRARYLLCAFAVPFACSNDSNGLDPNDKLDSLTVGQEVQLCLDLAEQYPRKTVTCGGVQVMEGLSGSDCIAGSGSSNPLTCSATVGDAQNCAAVEYADPCGSNQAHDQQVCAAFLACFGSGSGF